ncbi:MAG TPA: hypothetical protein VMD98_14790, partial [Bryocella sp.]|nr:hypothetical protein [Bryocella sp.]
MKKRTLFAAASLLLAGAISGAAQDRGYWRAASSTATGITGDITISIAKVTINFATFPLAQIRALKPAEVSAVFDADVNAGISGTLYRLDVPAGKRFLHRNTLCGEDDTQWMATYVTGHTLDVAFFSGDDMPVFSFDAIQKSSALCGTYA